MQRYAIACGFICSATIFSAMADHDMHFSSSDFKVDAALGWLEGKSQENYYDTDTGKRTDQLDWKIKQTPILKMGLTWDMMHWLSLNAQGWTTFASRGSKMDEYYWYGDTRTGWSEWDAHPNTHLNHANELDVNMRAWIVNQPNYRLGGMVGYQQTRFSWNSVGGSYYYDDGDDDWVYGEYDNAPFAGYNQVFRLPYIGITGMYRYQDIEFNAAFKFSPWAKAHGNDEYYYYENSYRTTVSSMRYYAASVDVGYYLTPHAKVFTALNWSKYKEGRGGYQEIDRDDNETDYNSGDANGLSNKHYSVTAGLQYTF